MQCPSCHGVQNGRLNVEASPHSTARWGLRVYADPSRDRSGTLQASDAGDLRLLLWAPSLSWCYGGVPK